MLSINEIKEYLQKNLKPSRYEHILGVAETAKKLASVYGVDENKAEKTWILRGKKNESKS